MSALKESENTGDTFIRVFNPTGQEIELVFNEGVFLSNMFEEKLEVLKVYKIKGQEILNILIERK